MDAPPRAPSRPGRGVWRSRIGWLLVIWTASVAALGLAAGLMKLLMRSVGLG